MEFTFPLEAASPGRKTLFFMSYIPFLCKVDALSLRVVRPGVISVSFGILCQI